MLQVGKIYYLLLLFGLFSHKGFSQTASIYSLEKEDCDGKIQGVVHDNEHNRLPGVSIWIKEIKRGIISDLEGKYFFEGLCPSKYTVIFSYLGFKTQSHVFEVSSHSSLVYNLNLMDEAIHLEEIEVQDSKIGLEESTTQNTSTLSEEKLTRLQGKNLGSMLQEINGVGTLQTGNGISKPVIQGMHSNRIQILNNGIRQEGQQWGMEHAPEIDPFLAKKLSVIKGAATVEYGGEAVGGVVIVSPPELRTNKGLTTELHLVGMSNGKGGAVSGSIESNLGNIKGLAARIQGTYRRLGDSQAPNYVLSNTGIKEFNFSTAIGLKREKYGLELFYSSFNTEVGILAAAHIGNTTDLYNAIRSGEPAIIRDFTYEILNPRQKVYHHLLKAEGFLQISDNTRLQVRYGFQTNNRQEFDIRRGGRSDRPSLDLRLLTQTLDVSLEYNHHQFWKGKIGTQSIYQNNFNDVGLTGTRRLIPDYNKLGTSLFWIERLIKNKWEAELGLRYDYIYLKSYLFDNNNSLIINERNFHNLAANIGFIYRANQYLKLRSNLGFAKRNPQVNELYSDGLHHAAAAIELGDANLEAEQSIKWIFQAEWQKERWKIDFSPYVHHFSNYIYLQPREIALTIRGAFPIFQYVQQQADFMGLDAMLEYRLASHLFIRSEMSYLRATDKLIWMNPNRLRHSIRYERENWAGFRNVFGKIEMVQVGRQNRAPKVLNDIENIPDNFSEPFDFMAAPAGYTLFNLSLGSDIPLKKHTLTWGFEVENIFNTAYKNYMNRYRYFAEDMGRNFTLRLTYHFDT
jgi:iron complex outermembrane receptor protein